MLLFDCFSKDSTRPTSIKASLRPQNVVVQFSSFAFRHSGPFCLRFSMAYLDLSLIFCAIVFVAGVDAGHIKRHRFSTHRGPCTHHTTSTRHVATSVAVTTTHTSSTHAPTTHVPSSTHAPTSVATTTSVINIVVPSSTKSTTQAAQPLSTSLVPNNVKAGIAGGDAFSYFKDHIGWWYDW